MLKKCIEAIESRNTYENYEILILENNSTEQATFDYYKTLEAIYVMIEIAYNELEWNETA